MDEHLSQHLHGKTVNIIMLLKPRPLNSFNIIEKIQSRMMVATFNGKPSTTIISCYSPINASDEMDLITFYNKLSSLVSSISKHNILIIGEDMNTQKVRRKTTNSAYTTHQTEMGNI